MAENLSIAANNARFVDYPYDLRRDWWNDLQKAKLAKMAARLRPGETILDVGCNSGYFGEFCPPGCTVHGVDLSPELVAKAATRLASAQVAAAEDLPFPDQSVDVVTMAGVLEYLYDPAAAFAEMFRVARRCIVGTADHEGGIWGAGRVEEHKYMVRGYTFASLHAFLQQVGQPAWIGTVGTTDGQAQHYVFEVAPRG